MGFFDKVKEVSKDLSEKNDAYYAKQREKREEKLREKQEETAKKIKNPRLRINKSPGTIVVNEDRLIIGTLGKSYDVLYEDIKSLNMKRHILEIKTISEDFNVVPFPRYEAATHSII